MAIINQNAVAPALPNFCNMGTGLRILVMVDGLSVLGAMLKTGTPVQMWRELIALSAVVQPILLTSLVSLCLGRRILERLPYRVGVAAVLLLVLGLTTLAHAANQRFFGGYETAGLARYWLFAAVIVVFLLAYFHLRSRALSPALSEARLQALQARIRPHFLFNSLNAVLSLIRSDPRRAERALEDMADLFRVLMADNSHLSALEREITLCRAYLDLEQLRLGDRLRVVWHVDKMPKDALVPPLVLQPLVENAVYHGIEPAAQPGEISINIYRSRSRVHMVLRNPYQQEGSHHRGNKMALQNIRERLALHFDAEASLTAQVSGHSYLVHIIIPYVTQT